MAIITWDEPVVTRDVPRGHRRTVVATANSTGTRRSGNTIRQPTRSEAAQGREVTPLNGTSSGAGFCSSRGTNTATVATSKAG
jgi:hypothetical protein